MTDPPVAIATAEPRTADRVLADDALITFVAEHYERLLGLARLICRDTTDAADAVQIGLEQAWKQRTSLRDAERLRPWLDRIVAREAVRVSRRRRSWLARLLPATEVAWIESPDRSAALAPTMIAFRDAFRRLPPDQRAVVALHHHLGYSVAETAGIVGAPVETVRTRLRRATDRLRHDVEEAPR
jgi:RNA polymerase sigma-70 factor, ECF subfamily